MQHLPEADPLAAAHAKRRAMRAGGREVGYDGIVITDLGDRYQVRVRDPYRKKYVSAIHHNRKEAEAWGRATRAGLLSRKISSEAPTLRAAATNYLSDLRTSGASLSTHRILALACAKAINEGFDDLMAPKYRQRLCAWLADLKADKKLQPKVRKLMAELQDPGEAKVDEVDEAAEPMVRRVDCLELSANTRNTYLRNIRTVVKTAARDGEFADPLAGTRGFKVEKTTKPVFTPPELRAMLADERRDHPAWIGTALLLYTGCRIDEGLHIRWDDVDFTSNTVAVSLESGALVKGSKERTFPLQPDLREILEVEGKRRWGELWKKRAHGFIIEKDSFRRRKPNGALDRRFYDALQSLCKKAKVAIIDRRSPHSLRHTHAALRVATGESPFRIQGDLGHESDTMTRHYSREERSLRGHVVGWPANGVLYIRHDPPVAATDAKTGIK
jgi:integrase